MVNTMLYKTWKSSVTTGDGDPVWQGAPLLGDTVTPNEVAAGVANATRLDITDVKYILDKTGKVVTSFIKEGKNVDLDFVAFVISMLGGLDSADADFDPERNALVVRAHARPPLRDCLNDVNTRNVHMHASCISTCFEPLQGLPVPIYEHIIPFYGAKRNLPGRVNL